MTSSDLRYWQTIRSARGWQVPSAAQSNPRRQSRIHTTFAPNPTGSGNRRSVLENSLCGRGESNSHNRKITRT